MTRSNKIPQEVLDQWHLGQTSTKYETGNRGISTISTGKGDHGGVSYGAYQLSSKMGTLQRFLHDSGYDKHFAGMHPATPEFNAQWRELAKHDPSFKQAEHDFIERTHYKPELKQLKQHGIDIDMRGKAVHDMLWSTSVQYGGKASNIFEAALKGHDGKHLTDAQFIEAVQEYKLAHVHQHFSKSPKLWHGLEERIKHEKADLLSLEQAERLAVPKHDKHQNTQSGIPNTLRQAIQASGMHHAIDKIGALAHKVEQACHDLTDDHKANVTASLVERSAKARLPLADIHEVHRQDFNGKHLINAMNHDHSKIATADVDKAQQLPAEHSLQLAQQHQQPMLHQHHSMVV